jgi:hypothetical protein
MKPLKLQFKEALGGRNLTWYRDFTLIVIAGLAILFGVVFGMGADPVRAPFDLKVATGCFILAGVCVLLASNRVLALSCAVIVPAAIAGVSRGLHGESESSGVLLCVGVGPVPLSYPRNPGQITLAASTIPPEQVI